MSLEQQQKILFLIHFLIFHASKYYSKIGKSAKINEIEMISGESGNIKHEKELQIGDDLISEPTQNAKHQIKENFDCTARIRISCEFCTKSYLSYNSLRYHRAKIHRIHKSNQVYSCNVCMASFVQPCDIEIHMLTHAG